MEKVAKSLEFQAIACPACGLLCDDLIISRDTQGTLKVKQHGCANSVTFFERPQQNPSPRIAGKNVTLASAIEKARNILQNAKHPLIGGLGTDIQGMRAVMNLAETVGVTIDHMNSNSSMRNLLVLQNSGWQITTLTEVRNRVDLLVVVGTDIVSTFPRFFERNVWNRESMFGQDTSTREVVYLGGRDLNTSAGVSPEGEQPQVIPCDLRRLPEVLAVLRALVSDKKLTATEIAGIEISRLQQLAERLKAAKYSVVAWSASSLDFPHAELAVQTIAGIVETLNKTTRSSGLPLGGNDGDVGAYNTSTWISGYPFRLSYKNDHPEYDPYHFSAERLLACGEADALFWISSFSPERLPPESKAPSVVFGHAGMQFAQEPDVFLPIATPGLDCKGAQFRSDSSVALPLKQLRTTELPTLAEVLTMIEAGFNHAD